MKNRLNIVELSFYYCFWIFINVYALYNLFLHQTVIFENDPHLEQSLQSLAPGWTFLQRRKDVSDAEWSSWKFLFQKSWAFMIIQFIVSEILRTLRPSLVKFWYIITSITFVTLCMGLSQIVVIILQPIIFSILIHLGGKRISIWITSIALLSTYNSLKYKYYFWQFLDHANLQDEEVYLLLFAVAWIELRCISFSLDYVEKVEQYEKCFDKSKNEISLPSRLENVLNMFSYTLYLPLLYVGPIMLYEDFERSFQKENQVKLIPRLKRFSLDFILFLIYTFFMDLSLHFMYFYAMQEDMDSLKKLPCLALCGGGLWMGFQFHLKYVITYGTEAAFARLDNMAPPPTPRCIARIHVYSQMWRYFDVGLYKFLLKYIYKPGYSTLSQYITLSKITYKLIASFSTFCFIFMWHGTVWNIFVWSALNYMGILLEHLARTIAQTELYKNFKSNVLKTDAMEVRLTAFLCGPLLALSAVSNFYLFGGSEVGDLFFGILIAPEVYNLFIILFAVYCCCHVSMTLLDYPARTDVKRLTKLD